MAQNSFRLGRLFGIEVRINYSWLFLFALVAWSIIVGLLPATFPFLSPAERIMFGVIITVLLFASLLAHEFAHSLVARRYGRPVHRITLFLFGGAAEMRDDPPSPKAEFMIAAAGPLTTFIIAAVFYGLWEISQTAEIEWLGVIAGPLTVLNALIGIFNLLPGYPLDGGRLVRAGIWRISHDLVKATRIASFGGQLVGFLLMAYGAFQFITGAVISGIWLVLIGWFLLQVARYSLFETVARGYLKDIPLRQVMVDHPATIAPSLSVRDWIEQYVLRLPQAAFPVSQHGRLVGILTVDALRTISHDEIDGTRVSDVMQSNPELLNLHPDDSAESALQRMQQFDAEVIPVVEHQTVVGLVSQQRIRDVLWAMLRLKSRDKTELT